jgi:FkbM family methyltransferase
MLNNTGVRIWLMWIDNILSHVRRKRRAPRKFAILSPPFLSEQKIKHVESNTLHSIKVRNSVDLRTLYDIFYKEEYSTQQFNERISSIDSGYIVIDLGANIGCASLYFLHTFQGSHVIALEPDNENFKILSANLRNYTLRVTLLNAGVGPRDTFCDSVISAGISGQYDAYRFEESDSGKIKMRSLTGLIEEFSLNHRNIILKIDIEGYERYLFEGDTSWFENVDMVFIEGHDWMLARESTLSGFLSHVGNKNFDVFVRGENIIAVRHSCYE